MKKLASVVPFAEDELRRYAFMYNLNEKQMEILMEYIMWYGFDISHIGDILKAMKT